MSGGHLILYVGVTPRRLISFREGDWIVPDEFSRRFGLRACPVAAIERAHFFMEWTPYGPKGEVTKEEMTALKLVLTGLGYMYRMENGLFEYVALEEEYIWYGPMVKWATHPTSGEPMYYMTEVLRPDVADASPHDQQE